MIEKETPIDLWEEAHEPALKKKRILAKSILTHIILHNNDTLLDIGCGTASYIKCFQEICNKKINYYGLDNNLSALIMSKMKIKTSFNAVHADFNNELPFHKNTFSSVLCSSVLQLTKNNHKLFNNIYSIISDNGYLIIITRSHKQIVNFFLADVFPEVVDINLKRYPTIENILKYSLEIKLNIVANYTMEFKDSFTTDEIYNFIMYGSSALSQLSHELRKYRFKKILHDNKCGIKNACNIQYTIIILKKE